MKCQNEELYYCEECPDKDKCKISETEDLNDLTTGDDVYKNG